MLPSPDFCAAKAFTLLKNQPTTQDVHQAQAWTALGVLIAQLPDNEPADAVAAAAEAFMARPNPDTHRAMSEAVDAWRR